MDFFGYYTIDDPAKHPFMMFSTTHLLFIILIICCIYLGLKVSKDYPEEKTKKIEKIVSASLIFGEFIYYIWNIFKCPYPYLYGDSSFAFVFYLYLDILPGILAG